MESAKLTRGIEKLERITLDIKNDDLLNEVFQLDSKIKNEKFYLVVLGLFKRGKSSFINSLIAKEIVPTAVIPLTSVITIIEYGRKDYAVVSFRDRTEKSVDINQIDDYIAEAKNPHNIKNVERVNLFVNSDILKSVSIIDTPGVGSTLEHNTETTYAFIEKIDAAVFIISADIPVTEIEADFLKKLCNTVPKIIFVLNKKDLINGKDLESIISYNRKVLEKICNNGGIEIHLLSAFQAMQGFMKNDPNLIEQSGIKNITGEINTILKEKKSDILSKSSVNRFNSVFKHVEMFLEWQLSTLQTPIEKLEEISGKFERSVKLMNSSKDEFDILISGKIKQLQNEVTETIYEFGKHLFNTIKSEFQKNHIELIKEIKKNGSVALQEKYFSIIENDFDPLKLKMENDVVDTFKKILQDYSAGSNRFLNELVSNFSNIGTKNFDDVVSTFNLQIVTCFYYYFENKKIPLADNNKLTRSLLPGFIINHKVIPDILNTIWQNIDMNCGRINYDIKYKIQESFREFKLELNKEVENMINMLRRIIETTIQQKLSAEKEVYDDIQFIKTKMEELNTIR